MPDYNNIPASRKWKVDCFEHGMVRAKRTSDGFTQWSIPAGAVDLDCCTSSTTLVGSGSGTIVQTPDKLEGSIIHVYRLNGAGALENATPEIDGDGDSPTVAGNVGRKCSIPAGSAVRISVVVLPQSKANGSLKVNGSREYSVIPGSVGPVMPAMNNPYGISQQYSFEALEGAFLEIAVELIGS